MEDKLYFNRKFKSFCSVVGEAICYCQVIENDLTIIYSSLLSKNFNQMVARFEELNDKNLGYLIYKLEEKKYLTHRDATFLNEMRIKRNYLCHETFLSFVYVTGENKISALNDEMKKVTEYKKKLKNVAKILEDLKMKKLDSFQ